MAENVSRQTKSDKGIQKLTRDVLMDVLGLPHETANRIFKIIHARGDWISVKQHIRQNLPTVAWQRINQALDMIEHPEEEPDEQDPEMEPVEPVGDGESDAAMADEMGDMGGDMGDSDMKTGDGEDIRREGISPTFVDFLSEISAQQTARLMVRDKQTRRDAALATNLQRRNDIETELTDLEQSDDSSEKNLANQIKRTAMLRKRVDAKKQAEEAKQPQRPTGSF